MAAREGGRTGRRTFVEFDTQIGLYEVLDDEVVLVELGRDDIAQGRRPREGVGDGHDNCRQDAAVQARACPPRN